MIRTCRCKNTSFFLFLGWGSPNIKILCSGLTFQLIVTQNHFNVFLCTHTHIWIDRNLPSHKHLFPHCSGGSPHIKKIRSKFTFQSKPMWILRILSHIVYNLWNLKKKKNEVLTLSPKIVLVKLLNSKHFKLRILITHKNNKKNLN